MDYRRWLVALLLLSSVVGAAGMQSVDGGESPARLEIHRRVCPVDVFADLYNACHGLPQRPGVTISLGGAEQREARTESAGDVVFDELAPGLYFTGDDQPGGDFTTRHIFCSAAESPGVPRAAGGGAIILAQGESVICDWYILNPDLSGTVVRTPAPTPEPPPPLPSGTTLTVASWLCQDDYVDSDYAASCRATPGAGFRYWAGDVGYLDAAEAGADGVVRFDFAGSLDRRVVIAVSPPEQSNDYYAAVVDCTVSDTTLHASPLSNLSTYHMVAIQIAPGDDAQCDWYNVPYPDD